MEGLLLITCSDSTSLLLVGSIFSTKEKLIQIHCDLLGKIVFALPSSQSYWIITTFQRVSCITENMLSLAFHTIDVNEPILAGKQQKPIKRKPLPLILQCGIDAALLTCFQIMPPFAGTALVYTVSLAACMSCFGSHEEFRVTSSISIVRHV